MNGSDLLVVIRGQLGDPTPPDVPGYRRVAMALRGSAHVLQSEGPAERIDSHAREHSSFWVCGVTDHRSPAIVLADWFVTRGEQSESSAPPLSGHFVAAAFSDEFLRIWTDHMGTIPVFRASGRDGQQFLGTDQWTVAHLSGRTSIDPVSAQEFMGRGAVTSPFTIFDGVARLGPATQSGISAQGWGGRLAPTQYWVPSAEGAPTNVHDAARMLESAVSAFLDSVMAVHARPLVLLSGGEDSRVVAALASRNRARGGLRGVIILDHPNRELALARSAAMILGVELEPRWRPVDLYTADMTERLRHIGPGVDLRHAHAWGLLNAADSDLVLHGFGADFLMKAQILPSRVGGARPWSARQFDDSPHWRTDTARTVPMIVDGIYLDEAVAERRRGHLQWVRTFRPETDAALWSRYMPLSDWSTSGFFTSTWSLAASASPFLVGPALDAVRGLPEPAKLNGALFKAAFSRKMGLAGLIPRSGGEIPGISGPSGRAAGAAVAASFERWDKRAVEQGTAFSQGPWLPEEHVMKQSLALLDRSDPAIVDHCLGFLSGSDRREQVFSHPYAPTRLLQLVALAEECGEPVKQADHPEVNPLMTATSVRNARGFVLHVDPNDPRGQALIDSGGDFNPTSLAVWAALVAEREWDLVVDVGANYGEMLLGCEMPAHARVVAFEPSPAVRPWLLRSVAGQEPPVDVRAVAVSDRPGTATLLIDRAWSGTSRLAAPLEEAGAELVDVPVATLDGELCPLGARTACVKVDVEGLEGRVLDGAEAFLRSLDDYACLIEILHLSDVEVADLSAHHALYLWNESRSAFSRVAPCGPDQIRDRLATGAYYRQDAVLRPLHRPIARAAQ